MQQQLLGPGLQARAEAGRGPVVLGSRVGPSTRGHRAVLNLIVVSREPRVASVLPMGQASAFQLLLAGAALIPVPPALFGGRDPASLRPQQP